MKKTEEEKREFRLKEMEVGRSRFVLRKGVLDWGGTWASGFFVWLIVSGEADHHWLRAAIACVSSGFVGGTLVGLNNWYYYQKKYRSSPN
jgi:hypothetical protein